VPKPLEQLLLLPKNTEAEKNEAILIKKAKSLEKSLKKELEELQKHIHRSSLRGKVVKLLGELFCGNDTAFEKVLSDNGIEVNVSYITLSLKNSPRQDWITIKLIQKLPAKDVFSWQWNKIYKAAYGCDWKGISHEMMIREAKEVLNLEDPKEVETFDYIVSLIDEGNLKRGKDSPREYLIKHLVTDGQIDTLKRFIGEDYKIGYSTLFRLENIKNDDLLLYLCEKRCNNTSLPFPKNNFTNQLILNGKESAFEKLVVGGKIYKFATFEQVLDDVLTTAKANEHKMGNLIIENCFLPEKSVALLRKVFEKFCEEKPNQNTFIH